MCLATSSECLYPKASGLIDLLISRAMGTLRVPVIKPVETVVNGETTSAMH
jgi:hypothetical protein